MITTVTLNAAIDKTYTVPHFGTDNVFRVQSMTAVAGGKGINVARVTKTLGEDVTATGFVAGSHGAFITSGLDREKIAHDFVQVDGESRQCITVLDPADSNRQTELLEPGPTITNGQLDAMKRKIGELAKRSTHMVFSGSLPKGCPAGTYAELIEEARSANGSLRLILDTSGDALVAGIEAKPTLIKPNEHEIRKLLGQAAGTEADLIACIRDLMGRGIPYVIVSLGGDGALAGCNGAVYRVQFPPMEIVNPVGSGDSMVSGMVVAMKRGYSDADLLRFGCACGSANALTSSAGNVRPEDVDLLFAAVSVAERN